MRLWWVMGTAWEPRRLTSLDMHDIARSAKTYGIKNYYLVTKLLDQQKNRAQAS